jgi:hypothetical protein
MPRGGRRPGAGRKPGPSKRTIEVVKHLGPAGECAIVVLIDAMQNPSAPWSCRIQAASLVADRAFGRSPQAVGLELARKLNDMSLSELRELEARLVAEQRLAGDLTPSIAAEPVSADRR